MMKKFKKNEKGLLSLEACIAVTIFIFLMLFLYSFFVVFEVRNTLSHATLATANSMAFDTYETATLGESDTISDIMYAIYDFVTTSQDGFRNHDDWYNNEEGENGEVIPNAEFEGVVKERFIAYLTSGDEDEADKILKRYHVVDGVNGLDFSDSYVDGGKLYLSVKYEIEYEFNVFNLGNNKFEHKACSKLWK